MKYFREIANPLRSFYFKAPRKSDLYFLLFAILFLSVFVPFEPYDWVQRAVTAGANAQDYRGDAVIVAIDEKTERSLSSKAWSESDLATLLEKLGSKPPQQIIIDRQFFEFDAEGDADRLATALAALPQPAIWVIELSPKDAAAISLSSVNPDGEAYAKTSPQIPKVISGLVVPAVMTFQSYAFGAQFMRQRSSRQMPA